MWGPRSECIAIWGECCECWEYQPIRSMCAPYGLFTFNIHSIRSNWGGGKASHVCNESKLSFFFWKNAKMFLFILFWSVTQANTPLLQRDGAFFPGVHTCSLCSNIGSLGSLEWKPGNRLSNRSQILYFKFIRLNRYFFTYSSTSNVGYNRLIGIWVWMWHKSFKSAILIDCIECLTTKIFINTPLKWVQYLLIYLMSYVS